MRPHVPQPAARSRRRSASSRSPAPSWLSPGNPLAAATSLSANVPRMVRPPPGRHTAHLRRRSADTRRHRLDQARPRRDGGIRLPPSRPGRQASRLPPCPMGNRRGSSPRNWKRRLPRGRPSTYLSLDIPPHGGTRVAVQQTSTATRPPPATRARPPTGRLTCARRPRPTGCPLMAQRGSGVRPIPPALRESRQDALTRLACQGILPHRQRGARPAGRHRRPRGVPARGLAEELHDRLWARGSACTRVVIGAETEHGERLERVWRAEGSLTAGAIADRLRWQLDGWLQGSARHRPTAGISRLWLTPDEVVPAGGRQLGFWGSDAATVDRASRAVARVQGLLGVGSVSVPEWRGSRDPATQVGAHPRRSRRPHRRAHRRRPRPRRGPVAGRAAGAVTGVGPPRPRGRRAGHDADDEPVHGQRPGALSAPPMRLSVEGGPWTDVVAWAGPWPLEERWWDTARRRRRARLQLVTADGQARLAALERGKWQVEATYD